jgi:hypothetical protein
MDLAYRLSDGRILERLTQGVWVVVKIYKD